MDTIADHLLARSEDRRSGAPGRGRGLDLAPGGGRVPGPRPAGCSPSAPPDPSMSPSSSTTSPNSLLAGGHRPSAAVCVGANPTHRGADLARDLAHTRCQFLVTDRAHLPLVDGSRSG